MPNLAVTFHRPHQFNTKRQYTANGQLITWAQFDAEGFSGFVYTDHARGITRVVAMPGELNFSMYEGRKTEQRIAAHGDINYYIDQCQLHGVEHGTLESTVRWALGYLFLDHLRHNGIRPDGSGFVATPFVPSVKKSDITLFAIRDTTYNQVVEHETADASSADEIRREFKSRRKDWGEGYVLHEVRGCEYRELQPNQTFICLPADAKLPKRCSLPEGFLRDGSK